MVERRNQRGGLIALPVIVNPCSLPLSSVTAAVPRNHQARRVDRPRLATQFIESARGIDDHNPDVTQDDRQTISDPVDREHVVLERRTRGVHVAGGTEKLSSGSEPGVADVGDARRERSMKRRGSKSKRRNHLDRLVG